MTRRSHGANDLTVAACHALLAIEPLIARLDEDLLVLMRRAARQPATRLIAVVDESGVLAGVVPIVAAADAVVARVAPEALLAEIADVADVARFGHAIEARVARDVMAEPASVRPDASIGEAFRRMHVRGLPGLYVVDDAGRPSGYLDLLELIVAYVDTIERSAQADR
jgi:CBS domain-containing protein